MNSKRKWFISIGAMVLVVLAAVIAIAVVYAANNVTIQSQVKITYEAAGDIAGKVTGAYKHGDGGSYTSLGEVEFNGSGTDPITKTLNNAMNIALNGEDDYVIFRFGFTNTNGSNLYNGVLKYMDDSTDPNEADSNIVISYGSSEDVTEGTKVSDGTGGFSGKSDTEFGDVTIPANTASEVYYYVKVMLVSKVQDAEFSGTFKWELDAPAQA